MSTEILAADKAEFGRFTGLLPATALPNLGFVALALRTTGIIHPSGLSPALPAGPAKQNWSSGQGGVKI